MSEKFNLDRDEVVILKEVSVAHGGVMAVYTDELLLTNKRIICLHKGMLGGIKTTYIYPLDQIKVYGGVPQVQKGKLSNGTNCLDVYLLDGEEHFNFQSKNKETISKWIDEIRKIFGCPVESTSDSKGKRRKGRIEIEDDSVLGAFRDVGNEFKDVGKEFAAAFGIKFPEKEVIKENVDDDDDDGEAVEFKYQPEGNEVIILSNADVSVYGDLECNADALLLTNKRLVIEHSKGFFNNQKHIDTFELTEVKKYKEAPQIRLGKYEDEPALDAFFTNAHLIFQFDNEGNRKKQTACIERWVRKATQALDELSPQKEETSARVVCKNCGAEIANGEAFCTNCGAKVVMTEAKENTGYYICKQCGTKVEKGLKFCMECGTPIDSSKKEETIQKQESEDNKLKSSADADKAKMPIDQQIELLQKLKALVDAGVLSQEEFEQKKKEIL